MDDLLHQTKHKAQQLTSTEKDAMFADILANATARPVKRESRWRIWWLSFSTGGAVLAGGLAIWLFMTKPAASPYAVIADRFIQRTDGSYLPVHSTQYALEIGGGSAVGKVDFSTWEVNATNAQFPTEPSTTLPALSPTPLDDTALQSTAEQFVADTTTLRFGDADSGNGLMRYITNHQPDQNLDYCDTMTPTQAVCFYLSADGHFVFTQLPDQAPANGLEQLVQLYQTATGLSTDQIVIRAVHDGYERNEEYNLYPAVSQSTNWVWDATVKQGKLAFIAGNIPVSYETADNITLITPQQALERLQTDFGSPVAADDFFKQHFNYTTILNAHDFDEYGFTEQPPSKPQLTIQSVQLEYVAASPDDITLRTPYNVYLPAYRVIGQENVTGMPFEALVNAAEASSWLDYTYSTL